LTALPDERERAEDEEKLPRSLARLMISAMMNADGGAATRVSGIVLD